MAATEALLIAALAATAPSGIDPRNRTYCEFRRAIKTVCTYNPSNMTRHRRTFCDRAQTDINIEVELFVCGSL